MASNTPTNNTIQPPPRGLTTWLRPLALVTLPALGGLLLLAGQGSARGSDGHTPDGTWAPPTTDLPPDGWQYLPGAENDEESQPQPQGNPWNELAGTNLAGSRGTWAISGGDHSGGDGALSTAWGTASALHAVEELDQTRALNENTCASARCHPMLNSIPVTSRHGKIKCTTCHTQRRSHTEQCVSCHEQIRGHTEGLSIRTMRERMDTLLDEPELRNSTAEAPLPPPVSCESCHLQQRARPATFPQGIPADHVPADKREEGCVGCHSAHDPKPMMGHPLPLPYGRRGREGCLSCHLAVEEVVGGQVDSPASQSVQAALAPVDPYQKTSWAPLGFMDWVLTPPLVQPTHGHGTVECIACHGAPPSFRELAGRVHHFELESVRCGRCHTGSNIIDQQVLLSAAEPRAGQPHLGSGH